MGSIQKQHIYTIESSQSLPPINNPETPNQPTSNTGFPILAIAVLCIMATAFLLVIYYILLTKCCLNWQQIDPLRRFSFSRSRRNEDLLMAYSPSWQCHGLDDILIREIPTFQYTKLEGGERSLFECVVCLNEFQEQDMLRILPHCGHGFHLDCIDVWLQSNAKCPLCRSSISGTNRYPTNRIVAPTSSPQDPQPFLGGDEDYVVIELGGENRVSARNLDFSGKFEQKQRKVKARKFHHVSIMGDECIDVREKDERFSVQPLRRSFSMDSAADRHVYLAVQEIIRENGERNRGESSSRSRRLFFPFGNGRGSRSAILPVEF